MSLAARIARQVATMARRQGRRAPALAPERHYLQADGVNDIGLALNAAVGVMAAGTAGEICLITKSHATLATFAATYAQLVDTSGSPGGSAESVSAALGYAYTDTRIDTRTWPPNTSSSVTATANLGAAGPVVHAMCRRNGARELRSIVARAGTVLANVAVTPTVDRDAAHVAFAGRVNLALVPSTFGSLPFVAGVLLDRYPTPTEVARYSGDPHDPDPEVAADARDATRVWPSAIHGYWPATSAVGTAIPAFVGSVPVSLIGGWSAAERVSL